MDPLPIKDIPTRALVVEEPNSAFELRDVILDEVRPREVLVQMKYTGICHTDLAVRQGAMPIGSFPAVLGHEGAGVIRRLGADVQGLQVGDHVLLSFASCMDCPRCHEGQKGVCAQITRINFGGARGLEESPIRLPDGRRVRGQFFGQSSFSELSIVDVRSVVKYSGDEKDLSFLAPLGCGYMTGAGTIFNELRPKAKSTIAIFGLGAVGLAAVMAAKYKAVNDIIAVDNVPAKLELALSVGAKHVIDSTKHTDIAQAIHGLYSDGVDYIMDTTGSSLLVNSGIKALGHAGTMALVGVFGPEDKLHVNALDLLTSCKSVVGIILGSADPQELLPQLLEMVHAGSFPVNVMSKVYPAKEVNEAIADLKAGATTKAVLAW